jgi:predicted lipoprotein
MPKKSGALQSVAWRRNEKLQSVRKNLSAVAADLPAALLDTWLAVGIIGGTRVAGCV